MADSPIPRKHWSVTPRECGVTMTLSNSNRGSSSGGGSEAKTSSPAPLAEHPSEGLLAHDRSSCRIDQVGCRLHPTEFPLSDQAARFGRQGAVDRDEVAAAHESFKVNQLHS